MARQPTKREDFDTFYENWLQAKYAEEIRYPLRLHVEVEQPISDGSRIVVSLLRDQEVEPQHCLIPTILFNENLNRPVAKRLSSALTVIRKLQGLDAVEGIAFLVHLFFFDWDFMVAAAGGPPSMLSLMALPPFSRDGLTADLIEKLECRFMLPVKYLLDVWETEGGTFARGLVESPDGSLGRATYLMVPPGWLTLQHLAELGTQDPDAAKVPLLVEPQIVTVAESVLDLLKQPSLSELIALTKTTSADTHGDTNTVSPESNTNIFRYEGDFWKLVYQRTETSIKDAKGLHYLAHLLERPYQESHVLDMVRIVTKSPEMKSTHYEHMAEEQLAEYGLSISDLGDAGDVLEPESRVVYEQALVEAKNDLAKAQSMNDVGSIEQAQKQVDFLRRELSKAYGIGNKSRKVASAVERARVNVRQHICTAINKIKSRHKALGRHLENSIRTGTFCSYLPNEDINWVI